MFRMNIVECFDDGSAQLLRYPTAFSGPTLNFVNPPVTLLRVIVTGVYDYHAIGHALEQIAWQRGNIPFGNSDDYDLAATCRLLDGDGSCSRFSGPFG